MAPPDTFLYAAEERSKSFINDMQEGMIFSNDISI